MFIYTLSYIDTLNLNLFVILQIAENMALLTYICGVCYKSAMESYKFIKQCQNISNQLTIAVENLSHGFSNTTEDLDSFPTMFLSIKAAENKIEQFYDITRPLCPEKSALARFKFISSQQKSTNNKGKRSIRKKDFSTIFIKTHELMLDPSKPEYRCKMCSKFYPTSGSLRQHFFSLHFKKEFQCPDCGKGFGTSGLLHTHQMQSHNHVTCNECGKKLLNRQSTLKRHAMTHFTGAKICDRCGRKYKKINDYERHMEQDSCTVPSKAIGTFICDYCGKETHFRHQLLSHIRHEHLGAEGFTCKWCKKKLYSQSALKVHVLKHTKEKKFICALCGGKYVTLQSLINHTRLHTGERPYPCSQCDQSFLSASRRKDHVDRYHNQIVFECDQCHTKLNAKRSLLKHKRNHCQGSMEAK